MGSIPSPIAGWVDPAAIVALLMIPACVNGFQSSEPRPEKSVAFAIPGKSVVALGAIAFLSLLTEGGRLRVDKHIPPGSVGGQPGILRNWVRGV